MSSILAPIINRTAIVRYDDVDGGVLRQVAAPCATFEEGAQIAEVMGRWLDETDRGLAAPQLAVSKRVIIYRARSGGPIMFMVNPRVVQVGGITSVEREGCLSYPGVWVSVSRPRKCRIEHLTARGTVIRDYAGVAARTLQHEIDHLNGVTIVDKS